MQKTKLGISVGLVGASVYFFGLFSGYLSVLILVGYILLVEDNAWLRRTCLKALILMVGFSIIHSGIDLIPSVTSLYRTSFSILGIDASTNIVNNLVALIREILSIIQTILFLILGFKSLTQGSMHIPVIDNFLSKYVD